MSKEMTLPLPVLEIVAPGFSTEAKFQELGLEINGNLEVDMEALALLDLSLAQKAQNYWESTRSFYDALAVETPNLKAIETEREILNVKQLDTVGARVDLKAEFTELIALPFYGDLIKSALKKEVDWTFLSGEIKALGGAIEKFDTTTIITFTLPGRTNWSATLGGEYSRGEIKREFKITINHAKWRDRKIRRLQALAISVIEIWPAL